MRRDEEQIVKRLLVKGILLPSSGRKHDDQRPDGKMPVRDMNTGSHNAVETINKATRRKKINSDTGDT